MSFVLLKKISLEGPGLQGESWTKNLWHRP